MHSVIQQVTDRIIARSQTSRAIYLKRVEQARMKGTASGRVSLR